MHRIIKIEEEDYPEFNYEPVLFNHCVTTFHDQDSNQPAQAPANAN